MIRDVPLLICGATDPFTNLPGWGGPCTPGSPFSENGQLLRFHPRYARLAIFITSLSGTSPSIQFTVGSYYGSNNYTLPPITSPQYVYIIGNENKTIITYLNTSNQVLQQVELPYNIFLNGVNVSWSLSGTSPAFNGFIHFEFEDEEEGEE
jgi:hypothetical protein